MTGRRRVPLDEVMDAVLPGLVCETDDSGFWRSDAGPAAWALEPDGGGFWLVLTGPLAPPPPPSCLLDAAREWHWPFKVVREQPGGPASWCAEIRLCGTPGDAHRLTQLVGRVGRRTSRDDTAAGEVTPAVAETDLAEAFGDALKQVPGGFRLTLPDAPAMAVHGEEGWVLRCTVARPAGGPGVSLETVVEDFLAVANGRLRGCRAVVEASGSLGLETYVAWEPRPAPVRAAADALAGAARLVMPACQTLVEQPVLGAFYRDVLWGVPAAPA